jgi:signal transduction histidine kinase
MSVTASWARRYWVEALWVAFAGLNLLAMLVVPASETLALHFIWLSFALLYGFRLWRVRATLAVLAAVCLSTGITLGWVVARHAEGANELAEVPLMGAMFLAIVWHARRRQAAVEQVHKAAERERAFVRDASHQLKTPLAIARGYAQLVRDSSSSPELTADTEILLNELDRLRRIAEGLLLLAASEEEQAIARRPIDFEELVVGVAQRWSAAASRAWRIDVRAEGLVSGDRERLDSAIDALVDNAVKATKPDDRIEIVGRSEGSVAIIEISDGGCGIGEKFVPMVFQRFWSRWPPASGESGTGLGLAIASAIVESHAGEIAVTSTPGTGTTVAVRIPGFVRSPLLAGELAAATLT